MSDPRRCECCDFEFTTVEEKEEHVTYMQTHGLYESQREETEKLKKERS